MTDRRFSHGLMIGKFYPPHLGHLSVIEHAAGRCEHVSVVVAAASHERLTLGERVDWLGWAAAQWPNVSVIGIMDDHPIDYEDSAIWDLHEAVFRDALAEIGEGVDVDSVFSGEDYGDELARRFGASHVRFRREPDGASGTRLRSDLSGHWADLIEPARIALARRIVVIGAESTGTTTLARELATTIDGAFVAEYGRIYSAAKLAAARQVAHNFDEPRPWMDSLEWTSDEFDVIAARQTQAIDSACISAPVVIADTDALATSVWHDRYIGGARAAALTLANATPPDLYIVTTPDDVPFRQDGLRDGETVRLQMHQRFIGALTRAGVEWITASGSREARLELSLRACQSITAASRFDPGPTQSTSASWGR
jgi:NadR type nicotinamide-nucleotide adenylyltransferase